MENFLIAVMSRHVLRHATSLMDRLHRGTNIFANVLPANDTEIPAPQIYNNSGLIASFWRYEFNSTDNSTGVGVVSIVNVDNPAHNATAIAKNFFGFLSGLITPVDSNEPYPANFSAKNAALSYATAPVDGFNTDYPIPNTYALAHTGTVSGNLSLSDIDRVKDALDQATHSMWKAISPDPELDWSMFAAIISLVVIALLVNHFWDDIKKASDKCSARCGTFFSKACTREQQSQNKFEEDDEDLDREESKRTGGVALPNMGTPLLRPGNTGIN